MCEITDSSLLFFIFIFPVQIGNHHFHITFRYFGHGDFPVTIHLYQNIGSIFIKVYVDELVATIPSLECILHSNDEGIRSVSVAPRRPAQILKRDVHPGNLVTFVECWKKEHLNWRFGGIRWPHHILHSHVARPLLDQLFFILFPAFTIESYPIITEAKR